MCRFAITTLTCNNRLSLLTVIRFFLQHSQVPSGTQWFIFFQGCSSQHIASCEQTLIDELSNRYGISHVWRHTSVPNRHHQLGTKPMYAESLDLDDKSVYRKEVVEFTIHCLISSDNLGLSRGNNILNLAVQDFEYVLLLEDDWVALPSSLCPSRDSHWISTLLDFLDLHTNVSTLFLRQYSDDREKEQFGWSRGIPYKCHQHADHNFNYATKMKGSFTMMFRGVKMQHIPDFLFTFNPHIRRNADYYRAKVFPLPEFQDLHHKQGAWTITKEGDCPHWGSTEALTMEKTRHLKTFNVASGWFGHLEDFEGKLRADGYLRS